MTGWRAALATEQWAAQRTGAVVRFAEVRLAAWKAVVNSEVFAIKFLDVLTFVQEGYFWCSQWRGVLAIVVAAPEAAVTRLQSVCGGR